MGQVPQSTEKSILIIGNGKTAKHLSFYFKNLNFKINQWHYKNDQSDDLEALFQKSHYSFLLIKDDVLIAFVYKYPFLQSKKSFHCSGSQIVPGLRCLHPLMSFSTDLYEKDFYKKIHWAVFEPQLQLTDCISELKNPWFYVPESQKALYHTMCVMSGNFTQILLTQVISQWNNTLQLKSDSLKIYMQKTLENFWNIGHQALTGPLVRKDLSTIQKHLQALDHHPQLDLYLAFLKLSLNDEELLKTQMEIK
jgi:hypothetical protein